MILLDTHVWYWWLSSSPQMPPALADAINAERAADAVAVSVISCWEIAQKAAAGRLDLKAPAAQWLGRALADPRTLLQPLTPEVVVSAVALPGNFHRDPADQIIVATARARNIPLVTLDRAIQQYPHVQLYAVP